MIRLFLPLSLFALLTACGGVQPTQNVGYVAFDAPSAILSGRYDVVFFLATPDDKTVEQRATAVTFAIGDRTYEGQRSSDGVTWEYGTANPCHDLPQGRDITARYELVDASKTILASENMLLTLVNTCQ